MLSRITRNLVGLLCWLLALAALLVLNAITISSNYVGTKIAFELLGFEMRPLRQDELVGWLFQAVAPRATLAHLFALAISLSVAVGIFLILRLAFNIYRLHEDRHTYLDGGDSESARLALRLMVRDAVLAAFLLIPMLLVANWDIDLFRFRSIANSLTMEFPRQTVGLRRWDVQLRENGHLFAWRIAQWGAWGYLAVTVISCLCTEYALLRISEYWSRFVSALEALLNPQPEAQPLYGYDAQYNPVHDRNVPVVFDAEGRQIYGYDGSWVPVVDPGAPVTYNWQGFAVVGGNGQAPTRPGHAGANTPATGERPRSPEAEDFGGDGALFDPPRPETTDELVPETPPAQAAHEGASGQREVIGRPEVQASLSAALARPDLYHVDPGTGAIWDRRFWDRLHNLDAEEEPEPDHA